MTPRELSPATVTKRLVLLRELLEDLDLIGPVDAAVLQTDRLRRRALERILTQLVEIATDVNQHIVSTAGQLPAPDYRSSFDGLARVGVISRELADDLQLSVGLRNILTHEYVNVDLEIVASSVPRAAVAYGDYVGCVARWLQGVTGSRA